MLSFKNFSIKTKLMVLTMLAVMTAMSLACTCFVINDLRLIRDGMAHQLSALGNLLGANTSAALTFDDNQTAEQFLSSLKMQPFVTRALLFDGENDVFATYYSDQQSTEMALPPLTNTDGHQFVRGRLEVTKHLYDESGETIGTLYLEGNLAFVRKQLFRNATIIIVVMLVACGAAYLLASKLQHYISGPIITLTRVTQEITRDSSSKTRAQKSGEDELGTLCDKFNHMLDQIEHSKQALEQAHNELEQRVKNRTQQLSQANEELSKEVTDRVKAEQELELVHREFIDSARRAGMAEIATGVLHNVGNVLNSVNVSASMLNNQISNSKTGQLGQVVNLLEEHDTDLGAFVTKDDKGKRIPAFLKMLSEHMTADEQSLLEETQSLITNIDHIKTIISTQQSYATSGGMVEPINVNLLLDDAVKLHAASFGKHKIKLVKDYGEVPTALIDKQRLMQIVINLVKNAKEALRDLDEGKRVLTLHTQVKNDRLSIAVSDSGIGISAEQLTQIFSHGFTTKKTGHGFGLHSCANAATEMKGKLSVASDGHLQGATFTLDLPLQLAALPETNETAAAVSNQPALTS